MIEQRQLALEVKGLSKRYILPNDKADAGNGGAFFALDDVSFNVYKGDVIGIIGSNGSGKSTLLKILSQITKPTAGEARFYGTITSILDIGNNVHPDLTGYENVIMHLKLAGIGKSKFGPITDQIREFSEVGGFFNQPVKYYSSGMFLRLAFSLAFHLSVDILVLDEVLSVGDEGFRLKCFDLLQTLTKQGKTILFVSHNRFEILELANKCIWLDKGRIKKMGQTAEILGEYFAMHRSNFDAQKLIVDIATGHNSKENEDNGFVDLKWNEHDAPGNDVISIRRLSVEAPPGSEKLYNTEPVLLRFLLFKKKPGIQIGAFFFLQDVFYQPVLVGHFLNNTVRRDFSVELKEETGLIEISCTIPPNFLAPGKYYFLPRFGQEQHEWNSTSNELFRFSEGLHFTIYAKPGFIDFIGDLSKSSVRPPLNWEIKRAE